MNNKKIVKKVLMEILDWSKVFLFALLISFFIRSTVVASAIVPTGSMEETIMIGSRIIINRLAYTNEGPERGDIVSFY